MGQKECLKKNTNFLLDMPCMSLKAMGLFLVVLGLISLHADSFGLSMIIVLTGAHHIFAVLFAN